MDIVQQLDAHLKDNNMYEQLRQILTQQEGKASVLDLAKLGRQPTLYRGKRYLQLQVKQGKGFLDTSSGEDVQDASLSVSAFFGDNSFLGSPVMFSNSPDFAETFMLPLQDVHDSSPLCPFSKLRHLKEPLLLVFVRSHPSGSRVVLSSPRVEWRKCLIHGSMSVSLELNGGQNGNDLIGLVDLEMKIVPLKLPLGKVLPVFIEQQKLMDQLAKERALDKDIERKFNVYAKTWWKEFVSMRTAHAKRSLSLFGLGRNGSRRFACTFVRPLLANRCIGSPLHAARFVRLLDYKSDVVVGGDASGIWHENLTTLIQGHGDVHEHAILLCSLLLGFGLNAFVGVGTKKVSDTESKQMGLHTTTVPHTWVVTIDPTTLKVVFWESLTGQQFPVEVSTLEDGEDTGLDYTNLYALFNHKQFYANVQNDSAVTACKWVLQDTAQWKAVDERAISLLPRRMPQLKLMPCTFNVRQETELLENKLMGLFSQYRRTELGYNMLWDSNFSYILSPALTAYEHQRLCGQAMGSEHFQSAVKNFIPVHRVFKGVPFQFSSFTSPTRILATMLKHPDVTELLQAPADGTRFACHVKIFPYAEQVSAVWVMLACHYEEEEEEDEEDEQQ